MQYDTGEPSAFSQYLPGFGVSTGASEDCLTLNIWTPPPKPDGKLLPVMIWIPGGALVSGGSSVPYTNGARFAAEQGIVVVTINYRVNVFGFPGAAGLDGHNLNPGLLDQRKAVEYVYGIIAHFGGDPARMTLFGQSAGGSSTDFWSYAWASDPLVTGLIIQSGAVGNNQFAVNRTGNFSFIAGKVGCGDGRDKDAELACMQGVNATKIMDVYIGAASEGIAFGAMADDETIFANWTERRERGLIARLVSASTLSSRET
jgi:cholinesterase